MKADSVIQKTGLRRADVLRCAPLPLFESCIHSLPITSEEVDVPPVSGSSLKQSYAFEYVAPRTALDDPLHARRPLAPNDAAPWIREYLRDKGAIANSHQDRCMPEARAGHLSSFGSKRPCPRRSQATERPTNVTVEQRNLGRCAPPPEVARPDRCRSHVASGRYAARRLSDQAGEFG